ncbi:MAG: hypothetical protein ACLU00_09415 [Mediterraneibacter faecis]
MFERIYQGAVIEALKYSPLYEEGMSDDEILAAHGILSYSQTLEWKGAVEYCLINQNGIVSEEKNRYFCKLLWNCAQCTDIRACKANFEK